MTEPTQLILGHGYVAKHLGPRLEKQGATVASTSRTDPQFITFDLEDPDSWENVPTVKTTFWMFPAVPLDLVKEFISAYGERLGQIITVGSTSGFLVNTDGETVDEASPLDLTRDRVLGEEFLRSNGAMTVMASGIYGPQRDPLDWIAKGYVGKSDKLVNMIHVEDLCQFLLAARDNGKKGHLYIASDNNPQTWRVVIDKWESNGWADAVPVKTTDKISKRVKSSASLSELSVNLKYQDFADRVL